MLKDFNITITIQKKKYNAMNSGYTVVQHAVKHLKGFKSF